MLNPVEQNAKEHASGGITNGNDLVAAYMRSGKHFPAPLAEIVCKMAEVGDRAQTYEQVQASFTIGFVWQLITALFSNPK